MDLRDEARRSRSESEYRNMSEVAWRASKASRRATVARRKAHGFLNRELSWLDFDRRVLGVAEDDSVPLLERVKLCAIVSRNLDEFFAVRIAGLRGQVAAGATPSDESAPGRQPGKLGESRIRG